jgi:hypothetical protein
MSRRRSTTLIAAIAPLTIPLAPCADPVPGPARPPPFQVRYTDDVLELYAFTFCYRNGCVDGFDDEPTVGRVAGRDLRPRARRGLRLRGRVRRHGRGRMVGRTIEATPAADGCVGQGAVYFDGPEAKHAAKLGEEPHVPLQFAPPLP